jgi:O-methyltransferase
MRTTRMRWVPIAKAISPPVLWQALYRLLVIRDIPDADRYAPHYRPWLAPEYRALYRDIEPYTVVPIESCWTLTQMLQQAMHVPGDVLEAGVFQGGTARLLKRILGETTDKSLWLFDSFEGMAKVSTSDRFHEHAFADTSLEAVSNVVGHEPHIHYRKGWIPETFKGLDDLKLCFAHIDVDLYQSFLDCLDFIYPRLSAGGVIVFDDYGGASCPGARQAVDEFFAGKAERPLALLTGQALVTKL